MTDPTPAGDFGYDLVHEAPSRPDPPSAPVARDPGPTSVQGPQDDSGEDLGYDEAHDF